MEIYRMPPYLVQKLISEISPFVADDNEIAVPLHLRVLASLNFYASGSYQRRVGMDAFVMLSQTTVSKCVTQISKVITNELGPRYIRFPQTSEEVHEVKRRFKEDFDFEGVMGIVDGSLIRIAGLPSEIRNQYISRKGYPALNTQFAIDSDMRILNVNARYPGSAHDTFVWFNSKIMTILEKNFNMDDQTDNIYKDLFLLGDLGYPLQPWLMIPVKDFTANRVSEKKYNKKQRKMRNKIERFIAIFKNTWRCNNNAERGLRYTHEKAGYIIYACSVLHNFLVDNSFDVEHEMPPFAERDSDSEIEDYDSDDGDDRQDEYLLRGRAIRDQLIADRF